MKPIEKLTAEHLGIYLAYGLEGIYILSDKQLNNKQLRHDNIYFFLKYAKPILRTRKSITKEELKQFTIDFQTQYESPLFDYNLIPYCDIVTMAKLHIDIFGLIESGLAVDKQTIKK